MGAGRAGTVCRPRLSNGASAIARPGLPRRIGDGKRAGQPAIESDEDRGGLSRSQPIGMRILGEVDPLGRQEGVISHEHRMRADPATDAAAHHRLHLFRRRQCNARLGGRLGEGVSKCMLAGGLKAGRDAQELAG